MWKRSPKLVVKNWNKKTLFVNCDTDFAMKMGQLTRLLNRHLFYKLSCDTDMEKLYAPGSDVNWSLYGTEPTTQSSNPDVIGSSCSPSTSVSLSSSQVPGSDLNGSGYNQSLYGTVTNTPPASPDVIGSSCSPSTSVSLSSSQVPVSDLNESGYNRSLFGTQPITQLTNPDVSRSLCSVLTLFWLSNIPFRTE